jgi:drug/metabolite transporter (DMT)-like permease
MGFAGVILLMGDTVFAGSDGERLWGQLAAVIATLCYAINGIYTKRLPGFDPVAITAGSLVAGSLMLLGPALWLQDWSNPLLNPSAWGALLVLGIFSTGMATWVYFVVVYEVGPGFLSTINYLIPAVAFVVGVLLLREPVAANQLIALAAILAGVWLIQPRHRSTS